ncbi:hypothetical protein GF337_17585 [candidate division KSB1 bacterium]|nr:hypothetical protein [candidate division KSB1 bacterium]
MKNLDGTSRIESTPVDNTQSASVRTVPRVRKFISKRRLVFLLKFLITALVMLMLMKNLSINSILMTFRQANNVFIYLTFLLVIPNIFIQYYKWKFLLKLVKPEVTTKESLYSLLVGFTFGFITPGRVGEFGRAFFIKDCSWVKLMGLAFIDKFFSLSIVIFAGAFGLMSLIGSQLHFYIFLPLVLFTISALLLLRYLLIHPEIFKNLLYRINILLPFREKIKLLSSSLDNFHQKQAMKLLTFSFIFYVIFFTQFYLAAFAFEHAALIDVFKAVSSTLLVKSMLPISLGDLGIRESAAVFFFGKIGVNSTTAFNASILIFMINILFPSLLGLVIVLKNRLLNLYDSSDSS